jgi:hypothetical protein
LLPLVETTRSVVVHKHPGGFVSDGGGVVRRPVIDEDPVCSAAPVRPLAFMSSRSYHGAIWLRWIGHTVRSVFIGDEKRLWEELVDHPAKLQYEADTDFKGSAGITRAEGIWFNLDDI